MAQDRLIAVDDVLADTGSERGRQDVANAPSEFAGSETGIVMGDLFCGIDADLDSWPHGTIHLLDVGEPLVGS